MQHRSGQRLDALTGLRFVAAMLVVLHHAGGAIIGGRPEAALFIGYVGVTFFFVLSGFVLTWSYRPGRVTAFYRRRIARVYPVHVLTWALALALAGWTGAAHTSPAAAVANLLLLQAWFPDLDVALSANAPSWSLSCEAFFYAVFPVVVLAAVRRRTLAARLLLACLVGYVAVVCALAAVGTGGFVLLYLNPLGRVVDFLLGIAIALAASSGRKAPVQLPVALLLSGLYLATVGVLTARHGISGWVEPRYTGDALFLPLACLVVWSAATSQDTRAGRALSRPWMVRLGVWSFALYLTHTLVLDLAAAQLDLPELALWSRWVVLVGLVGLVVLCVAVSGAVYRLVEAPLERRISGRVGRLVPGVAPA